MRLHSYYIYILASNKNTVIYIGVTSNLLHRIEEHKNGQTESFTHKYNVQKLVYYERTRSINKAITREKQLKNWKRSWKNNLITSFNNEWKDLLPTL